MTAFESEELDATLRDLLSTRPIPPPPPGLAQRAIRRARANRPLASRRWRIFNWTLNAVAALWIAVLSFHQLHAYVAAGGFDSWFTYDRTPATVVSTTDTAATTATSTTTDTAPLWLLAGATAGLLATAGVLAQRTTSIPDDTWTAVPV